MYHNINYNDDKSEYNFAYEEHEWMNECVVDLIVWGNSDAQRISIQNKNRNI